MRKFNKEIEEIAKSFNKPPIYDGIVNEKEYKSSNTKILWVLKEANSTGEDNSYDLRDAICNDLKTENGIRKGWEKTFRNIIYVTYGILNKKDWDDIPFPKDEPEIIDILQQIAYINIKKVGGGSEAVESELREHFAKSKQLLINQIEEFKPDVVIFGNTYRFFENELGLNKMNIFGTCHATAKGERIFINAYHPGVRTIKEIDYFEDIIKAYTAFKKQINNLGLYNSYEKDIEIYKNETVDVLNLLRNIKNGLINHQKYEIAAMYKDIENKIEDILSEIGKT